MAGIIGPLSEKDRVFFCIEELRYDRGGEKLWCIMFPNQIFDSREEAYEYLDIFVPDWKDYKERYRTEGLVYRMKNSDKEHWEE